MAKDLVLRSYSEIYHKIDGFVDGVVKPRFASDTWQIPCSWKFHMCRAIESENISNPTKDVWLHVWIKVYRWDSKGGRCFARPT
jgi:hypothetical protein